MKIYYCVLSSVVAALFASAGSTAIETTLLLARNPKTGKEIATIRHHGSNDFSRTAPPSTEAGFQQPQPLQISTVQIVSPSAGETIDAGY